MIRDRTLVVVMEKGIVLPPETDVMKLNRAQNQDTELLSRFDGECNAGHVRHPGRQRRCTSSAGQREIGDSGMGDELRRIDKVIVMPVLGCW